MAMCWCGGVRSLNKAFKYRIYPNIKQCELFAKTFGCVRFIYNRMLEDKIAFYKKTGKLLMTTPASYKTEFPWLSEVDSMALCNAQMQLQSAYGKFFWEKETGHPKFRSKKYYKNSYTTNCIKNNIALIGNKLKLPKLGMVHIKLHRQIPQNYKIKSVTISMESDGKYYASILTECKDTPACVSVDPGKALGLDYSSPFFYADSEGCIAGMPHFYRKVELELAKQQRKLSRMRRGGSNYKKQMLTIAKIYTKIRNQRRDWQHKESRKIADQWDIVCVEDIDMKKLAQELHLAKATGENSFGQFRSFLEYKMTQQGKRFITIDKWYPSSKLCRHCGSINTELTIAERTWICPSCKEVIIRDYNAAINIREAGKAMIA